jgi:5-methylcytosine-specific restriction endonuclease McrA
MSSATALRTLVLNADFRPLATWPLSLVPARDGITAVLSDTAAVLEEWDAVFRSPSIEVRVPKVIALRQYAPIDAAPKFCRRSILLRDRYRCQYCGEAFPGQELTFDHVIPRAAGGTTTWENILSCCVRCNAAKRDRPANYSGRKGRAGSNGAMRPLKAPRQPTTAELLRAGLEFLDAETRADYGSWLYWNAELKA